MENELQSIAVVERKVMMPMPDGVRLATDIYRPKNAAGKVPVDLGADAVQLQLLGHPERRARRHERAARRRSSAATPTSSRTSAAISSPRATTTSSARRPTATTPIDWLTKQSWSNGKIGTTGCSSTAEYQMGVAALGHPGLRGDERAGLRRRRRPRRARTTSRATGIAAAPCRCCSSPGSTASRTRCGRCFRRTRRSEDLIRASKSFDLAQHAAAGRLVEGARGICRCRTSSRTSTARAASSPTRCRSRPAAR